MADATDNIVLEHLKAIRSDVQALRADNHDIKAALTVVRAHNVEQNLLNSRLAAAELKIDRLEDRVGLRDE